MSAASLAQDLDLAGPEEDPERGSLLEARVGPGGTLEPFILQLSHLFILAYPLLEQT